MSREIIPIELRGIMREKNFTNIDLAEYTGLSLTSISKIVTGKSFPQYPTLIKIAECLGVKFWELFEDYQKEHIAPREEMRSSEQAIVCPKCGAAISIRVSAE